MRPRTTIFELEFSYPVSVDKIAPSGQTETFSANAHERQRLAKRFGLLELSRLDSRLTLQNARADKVIAVSGTLAADIVQTCVVTLESLPAHIEQNIHVLFAPTELAEPEVAAQQFGPDTEDIEPITDGIIDLGEIVAQHLGIALDPYPRKPGLTFTDIEYGGSSISVSPFAKLAELKKNPKK